MSQSSRIYRYLLIPLILIFILLTSIHIFSRHTKFTSDRVDTLLHLWFYEDYGSYLSVITMGKSGYLFYRDAYRTDAQVLTPNHMIYALAGLITSPFQIWPPYIYHGLKIILFIGLIFSLFELGLVIFKSPQWAFIATVIILFLPALPLPQYEYDVVRNFTPWWENGLSIIGRFDMRPHQALGVICLLCSLRFYFEKSLLRNRFITAVFLAIGGWVLVYSVIPSFVLISIDLLSSFIRQKRKSVFTFIRPYLDIFLFPGIILFLFMMLMKANVVFQTEPIWSIQFWMQDPLFFRHLYGSYLIYLIAAVPGLCLSLYKKDYKFLLFGLWFLLPLCFAPLTQLTHISWGRLLHFSIYIPLVFLCIPLFQYLYTSKGKYLFMVAGSFLLLASTYFIYKESVEQWNKAKNEFISDKYYPPVSVINTIDTLRTLVPKDARILTDFDTSIPLIAFLPVQTYVGEYGFAPYTFDTTARDNLLYQTFSEKEARTFLSTKRIQYILESPQFSATNFDQSSYSFITKKWQGNGYTLYEITGI